MQPVSHQTIRLSKGRHNSPHHGVCVMELASMLAGEPFSDHPSSVSPLIASFLRNYNDALDDDRRQDLYAIASNVVGTVAAADVEAARAARLVSWADAMWTLRSSRSIVARLRCRASRKSRHSAPTLAARYALRAIGRINDAAHAAVLAVIDELIAIGSVGCKGAAGSAEGEGGSTIHARGAGRSKAQSIEQVVR